ncbi:MAG: metal-dependent transcriptional regulator [Candidatus Hodarchaeota archaeon]
MKKIKPGSLEYKILLEFLFQDAGLKPGELKQSLSVRHSTINSALARMEKKQILKWNHHGKVELLEAGKTILSHLEVHHHLIEIFLVESLGLSPGHAHKQSLELAPHFSCETIKKICDKYGRPKICPNHKEIIHLSECHLHEEEKLTFIGD